MKKQLLLFFFTISISMCFASGHFEYRITNDGVYGGTIYSSFTKIEGADPKTFEYLDASNSSWGIVVTYAKDKNHVYHYNSVIEGADPETFVVINSWYAKDKNHVYDDNDKICEEYDGLSFEYLGNWFMKSKNGVYYKHNMSTKATKIEGADPSSFEVIFGTNYLKDKNQVYLYQQLGDGKLTFNVVKGADPKTFVIEDFSSPYTRDNLHIFYKGEMLEGVDSKAFKLLMRTSYGTDGKNVYYGATKLEDADPLKLVLEHRDIAICGKYIYFDGVKLKGIQSDKYTFGSKYYPYHIKNDSIVYYRTKRIVGADAKTFVSTDAWSGKGKDKNNRYDGTQIDNSVQDDITFGIYSSGVYYSNQEWGKLEDADPLTFKDLGHYYGKDKKNVYWTNERIEGADVASFKAIAKDVGVDAIAVYYGRNKIKNADPKTYTPINTWYGKDKFSIYYGSDKIENLDVNRFKLINHYHIKDQKKVFYQNQIIDNADPQSFVYVGLRFSKDKNHVYYENRKIENADPATFSILKHSDEEYSRDKDHVFYEDSIVKGADRNTFEIIIGSNCWIDKDHVFSNGKMIENSDAPTFEFFHESSMYSRDKNNIYNENKKIDADRTTFRILAKGYTIDKDHVYYNDKIDDKYSVNTFDIKQFYSY